MLALAAIVAVALVYAISIRPTWKALRQNQEYKEKLSQASNAPAQINQLKAQILNWESLSIQPATEGLFETVSSFCLDRQLKLRSMPEAQLHQADQYEIATNIISIQGDFKQLLELAYEIEVNKKLGRVSSLDFYKKKNSRTKRESLNLDIYLQNLNLKTE